MFVILSIPSIIIKYHPVPNGKFSGSSGEGGFPYMLEPRNFRIHAPGRLCIMGEHQDYLKLEVVSGAMTLGVVITAEPQESPGFEIDLVNTGEHLSLTVDGEGSPLSCREYLRSGLNLMMSRGYRYSRGWKIVISGDLPIGKGVSSSSAMCVAWIAGLDAVADHPRECTPIEIARLAFETEVVSFGEPGGMQDHVASAMGGLLHMDFSPGIGNPVITSLPCPETGFILIDSGKTKETIGMIQSIRNDVESTREALERILSRSVDLKTVQRKDIPDAGRILPGMSRFRGTLINRNLTRYTRSLFTGVSAPGPARLGRLINTHHRVLSRWIGSSSQELDALCSGAMKAGCAGAKVIGSGGGGCVMAYAPGNRQRVLEQLRTLGYDVTSVDIGNGVKVETYPVHTR